MPKPMTKTIISSLNEFGIALPDTLRSSYMKNSGQGELHIDSREISKGDIFCAIIGHVQDGRKYIESAIKLGAQLILCECENQQQHGDVQYSAFDKSIAIINFYQLNKNLFSLAKSYYQAPQDELTIVGITGTNGKTTTSQLLAQLLNAQQSTCAVIGTNGAGSIDNLVPIENTTPSACDLHQYFTGFVDDKFTYVAMEVSSHALSQKRVLADLFDIAIFTNLSRDHLDYHGSMSEYAAAKKQIFSGEKNQIAVMNLDDEQASSWFENWSGEQPLWVYGQKNEIKAFNAEHPYYVMASDIAHHNHGVDFLLTTHLGNITISSPLLGDFNIDNLLAAISVLLIQGTSLDELPKLVKQVKAIAGRMETSTAENLPTAVVDYAHTPDALEKALQACKQHCNGDLYVVFGCGGDRDKGKRPLMAQAAQKYADYIVVTNDNPRTEDEQIIAKEIIAGFSQADSENISITLNREDAVISTLTTAKQGDIVLLAGKGHEDYVVTAKYNESGTVIGTEKLAYNERAVVVDYYRKHMDSAETADEAQL